MYNIFHNCRFFIPGLDFQKFDDDTITYDKLRGRVIGQNLEHYQVSKQNDVLKFTFNAKHRMFTLQIVSLVLQLHPGCSIIWTQFQNYGKEILLKANISNKITYFPFALVKCDFEKYREAFSLIDFHEKSSSVKTPESYSHSPCKRVGCHESARGGVIR